MKTKQIIIVRRKYPDAEGVLRKVRTGKLAAQCCHASNGCSLELSYKMKFFKSHLQLFKVSQNWYDTGTRKVVVYVDSEQELLDLEKSAKELGIIHYLVTDWGLTEFNNEHTITALGLGPDLDETLDKLTGHLPLL